jgi:CubicO group peptidase (beta-lactamase class C family)
MQHLSLEQVIALFKDKPLDFPPGAKYAYSNSNYNLLAYIIEKVSGMRYGEFLLKSFFQPLSINMTGDHQDPQQLIPERAAGYVPIGYDQLGNAPYLDWSIKTGNGSLYSTTHDLLKWDQALYGTTVLKTETINKMFQKQPTAFSYGSFVRERFGHRVEAINGRSPGFTSSLERFPEDHATIIITANTYSGLTTGMAGDLASIFFDQPFKPMLPARPVQIRDADLRRYEGDYEFGKDFTFNPGLKVQVRLISGHLTMNSSRGENFLIPTGGGTFVDRLYGGAVSFGKATDGAPVLHWNFGDDYVARSTRP